MHNRILSVGLCIACVVLVALDWHMLGFLCAVGAAYAAIEANRSA